MTSLLDRPATPEDYEAERDQPRPGVWAGVTIADLRALTQEETDCLIRAELYFTRSVGTSWERDMRAAIGGTPRWMDFTDPMGRVTRTYRQRGGIDSDPLVRVLARRAWGDRDRQWFELHGVRTGDLVALMPRGTPPAFATFRVALAWPGEAVFGRAVVDASPGQSVRVICATDGADWVTLVSDRPREPPHASLGPLDPTRPQRRRRYPDGDPVLVIDVLDIDVLAIHAQLQDHVNRILDGALLEAAARGVPVDSMWLEYGQSEVQERRLMSGPQGAETPRGLRQVIARVWVERTGTELNVHYDGT